MASSIATETKKKFTSFWTTSIPTSPRMTAGSKAIPMSISILLRPTVRGYLASSPLPWQGEGSGRVPPPADRKHRCVKQRLRKEIAYCLAVKITEDLIKGKGVLRAQREHDRVVGCRCLQLEVK